MRDAARWLRGDKDIPDSIRSGPDLRDRILPPLLAALTDAETKRKCIEKAEEHIQRSPKAPPFAGLEHWAPFVITGLADE